MSTVTSCRTHPTKTFVSVPDDRRYSPLKLMLVSMGSGVTMGHDVHLVDGSVMVTLTVVMDQMKEIVVTVLVICSIVVKVRNNQIIEYKKVFLSLPMILRLV